MTYSPPFSRTSRIDELAFEVAELVGEIKAVSSMDTKPWLHRKMRIKTIHSSLAIEGNELAENEVESIIDGQKILGDPKDILEVQNAIAAYNGLDSLDPYSIDDLLCSHRVLMSGLVKEAGRFRSGNVGVYDGDGLDHAGTSANYAPEAMCDLFDWLTSTDLHLLIASCIRPADKQAQQEAAAPAHRFLRKSRIAAVACERKSDARPHHHGWHHHGWLGSHTTSRGQHRDRIRDSVSGTFP